MLESKVKEFKFVIEHVLSLHKMVSSYSCLRIWLSVIIVVLHVLTLLMLLSLLL